MEDAGVPSDECHMPLYMPHFGADLSLHSGNSHLDGTMGPPAFCEGFISSLSPTLQLDPESPLHWGQQSTGATTLGQVQRDHPWPTGGSFGVFSPEGSEGVCRVVKTSEQEHLGTLSDTLQGDQQDLNVTRLSTDLKDVCKGKQTAAQETFWAGILQAQLCVLDLQDELDKHLDVPGVPGSSSSHPQETLSLETNPKDEASPKNRQSEEEHSMEDSSSDEDQEDSLGTPKEGEGVFSEEDSEEECQFFNNPLFEASPCPAVITSPAEEVLSSDSEVDKACSSEEEHEPIDQGYVLWTESMEKAECTALAMSINQRTKEVPGYPVLPGISARGVLNSGSASDSAPQTNSTEESLLDSCCCTPGEDTKEPNSREHQPQESYVYCSSSELHITSRETVAAECDESLDGGLLLSPSSFSMIAAFLLEEENTDSCPSVSSQDFPESADHSGLPTMLVQLPLTPDLISWEEPNSQTVTFYGGGPSSPTDLMDLVWDKRAQDVFSSEEEAEVDGSGEEERAEPACTEDVKEANSRGEQAENMEEPTEETHRSNNPGPSESSPVIMSRTEEFMAGEGASAVDIRILLSNGALKDREAAKTLATKLYNLEGFRKSEVASHLQKNTEFSQMVAQEYLSFFDFVGKTLDQALRSLLKVLVLTGETQERERVLEQFSCRFYLCNPKAFQSADAVHSLTCAVMLLNTDLHGKNIGRCMSCPEFIINLDGMNDGTNFPKDQLKELYHSIRNEKLEWAVDEEELKNPIVHKLEPSYSFSRKKSNPFHDLPLPDPRAATYKQGILSRKMHADIDGKRTPWGKRSWKDFYTVLKGMLLCLLKDEYRLDYQCSEEVISIHHALAERANKYNKRPNVFRLQTADWRIFLFQAESAAEMNSWVSRINLVAAMFSSPPFPAAIGSQKRFVRPILPTAPCKHPLEDQRQSHELWMDTFTDDLADHQRNLPDKKSKAKDWEEHRTRGEYLLFEKIRYETYVKLLDAKLRSGTDDLDKWEAQLVESSDNPEEGSPLKKSHSSPSLNQEQLPVEIKVKRNISERRTYRKIIPKRNRNVV